MSKHIRLAWMAFLGLAVSAAVTGCSLTDSFRYTKEKADLAAYYDLSDSQALIYIDNVKQEDTALISDGIMYLPMTVVRESLDKRFYEDATNDKLLFTDSLSIREEDLDDLSMVFRDGENLWLSTACLEKYLDIQIQTYEDPGRIFIDRSGKTLRQVSADKKAAVRIKGGPKSEILTEVAEDGNVYLLDRMENWGQVRTEDGYVGYMELKYLDTEKETDIEIPSVQDPEPDTTIHRDHTICLVWQDMANRSGNGVFENLIKDADCVNVVSPVWFSITGNDGSYENLSSASYVQTAHSKDMEVWVLVNDFHQDMSISSVLADTKVRQKLAENLVADTLAVGADGINVDFEYITDASGLDFIQFLRELTILCHEENLVVSVDNKNPTYIKYCYDMEEQGKIVDYVVLMGYDEHWVGSDAGSVASLSYVEGGILAALDMVAADKIISGLPFYARAWTETDADYAPSGAQIRSGGGAEYDSYALDSRALSMDEIQSILNKADVTPDWDDFDGQYYAEIRKEHTVERIWIEDERSLDLKLRTAAGYNLAGYAFWRLGYETDEIWDMIEGYVD